jgi:hypothetical protein
MLPNNDHTQTCTCPWRNGYHRVEKPHGAHCPAREDGNQRTELADRGLLRQVPGVD